MCPETVQAATAAAINYCAGSKPVLTRENQLSVIKTFHLSICLGTCLAVCGCQTSETAHSEAMRAVPPPALPAGFELDAEMRADAPARVIEPGMPLDLATVLDVAVAHSPELKAFAWDVRRAAARRQQAGLWRNPELSAEMENFGGDGALSGTDNAEFTLSLAQSLPLGGDLSQGREIAGFAQNLAQWDFEAARTQVLLDVTSAYVDAVIAERRLELVQQELELAQTTLDVTQKSVNAGAISPVEATRASVPVVTAEVEVMRAEHARTAALANLALALGVDAGDLGPLNAELERVRSMPSPAELAAQVSSSPVVARWTAEIGARLAEQRLARAQAIPDVTATFGVRYDRASEDSSLVAGLSLPLPVFDRAQGSRRAASHAESAALERREAALLRTRSELNTAYALAAAARDEAVALQQRGIPSAEEAFAATRQSFVEGKLAFLDVLSSQETLFELRHRYLEALAQHHKSVAVLEAILGRPVHHISLSPRTGN